ncbi:4'-phosphopantetheinyl transferase superfamily protein [Saccharibacillus sp. JS10]|nr:4'-phosphopantetheinyl transferase superfamily protein [Saccharibacillus sp. JS10]MCQ4088211.1 4'-phosphopantetheinyl transferase superfamily protein [Saccharibacillus sp. JS10]
MVRKEDRQRKAVAHLLSSVVLGEHTGMNYSELVFQRSAYGKPYLAHDEAPKFNVSGSGACVVCAVAPTDVGIDVEHILPLEASTIKLLLGIESNEHSGVKTDLAPLEMESFYKRWTMLESWLKAEGTGLHSQYPLSSFSPRQIDDEAQKFEVEARQSHLKPWIVESYILQRSLSEHYAFSFCRRPEQYWNNQVAILDLHELMRQFRMWVS